MRILVPDGSMQQTARRSGRLRVRIAALLVPLGGVCATVLVGFLA
jgi:hypothetical protein